VSPSFLVLGFPLLPFISSASCLCNQSTIPFCIVISQRRGDESCATLVRAASLDDAGEDVGSHAWRMKNCRFRRMAPNPRSFQGAQWPGEWGRHKHTHTSKRPCLPPRVWRREGAHTITHTHHRSLAHPHGCGGRRGRGLLLQLHTHSTPATHTLLHLHFLSTNTHTHRRGVAYPHGCEGGRRRHKGTHHRGLAYIPHRCGQGCGGGEAQTHTRYRGCEGDTHTHHRGLAYIPHRCGQECGGGEAQTHTHITEALPTPTGVEEGGGSYHYTHTP
jgi:hypothetical protein